MTVAIIGDQNIVDAFGLIGVAKSIVIEPESDIDRAKKEFDSITREKDILIIFITVTASKALEETIAYFSKVKSLYPLLITVPDMSGKMEERDAVAKLIERAVGVSLENISS